MIECPRCKARLRPAQLNTGQTEPCPLCGLEIRADVYPALTARQEAPKAETLVDDQAGCFFHPGKKAAAVCSRCGRFICRLCDLELDGEHLCPACLDQKKNQGELKNLDNSRTLYDSVALFMALASCLISIFSGFVAPFTLYVVIRHWNAPRSILHRTRIRFVIAALIAVLQIAGTAAFFYFMAVNDKF